MKWLLAAAVIMLACMLAVSSFAQTLDANGNGVGRVTSHKTGATARVSPRYAAQFQGYIDAIEAQGATVRFMGGIRRGKCWSGSMHPCGRALDVCQLGRGRVDPRCHLPSRHELARIAAAHGLFEGGQWCHSDYGHAQVGESAAACGFQSTLVASARSHRGHGRVAVVNANPPFDRMTVSY